MSVHKLSSLYILVFPDRKLLKVGKADDAVRRGAILEKVWGRIDYANSYELKVPISTASRLEKSLHFLLSNHSAGIANGDGHTEMFDLGALDSVIKHIDLFLSSIAHTATLTKGIEKTTRPKKMVPPRVDLSTASTSYIIGRIGTTPWAIYSILKDNSHGKDKTISNIADVVGLSERTVMRSIVTLEEYNLIRINKVGRGNTYTFPQ